MWYIILPLIATIYILLNLVVPSTFSGFAGSYIIRPILWITLAIAVYLTARHQGLNITRFKKIRRWEIGQNPLQAAILIAAFQISLLIILGLLSGFGKSPYGHQPLTLLLNTLYFTSALIGIELTRAYLIKKSTTRKANVTLILTLVTILFMFISIPLLRLNILLTGEPLQIVRFTGENIIPLLATGLFASYLAYLGGAIPAIGYMGMLQAFEWYSPILPDLDWALIALVGTIGPAVGFMIIQSSIQTTEPASRRKIKRGQTIDPTLSWTAVSVICLLLVFFSFGFMGVQPTTIYSGSMRPAIDVGDVVIIQDTPVEEIQKGDIIQYKMPNQTIPIVHRVHEKYEENNTVVFITKGDANNQPDNAPVLPEQVIGKCVYTIPEIGWIPITVKEFIKSATN